MQFSKKQKNQIYNSGITIKNTCPLCNPIITKMLGDDLESNKHVFEKTCSDIPDLGIEKIKTYTAILKSYALEYSNYLLPRLIKKHFEAYKLVELTPDSQLKHILVISNHLSHDASLKILMS